MESLWWYDYAVSWSWWQIFKSVHVIKLCRTQCTCAQTHTHAHTHTPQYKKTRKTGEIWIRPIDYTNVNILLVILYYHFTKCYHKGKLGKLSKEFLCVTSYNCMWMYIYVHKNFILKSFWKVIQNFPLFVSHSSNPKLVSIWFKMLSYN